MSEREAINFQEYERQRKRGMEFRLEEHDRMLEHFRQERARMIAESEARLLEVRRQAEQDWTHFAEQVRTREIHIQR